MEAKGRTTSSKFQPDASSDDIFAGKPASRVRADFEGLLELAEKLQLSYDERSATQQNLFAAVQVNGLIFLVEFSAAIVSTTFLLLNKWGPLLPHLNHFNYLSCVGFDIGAVIFGAISLLYIKGFRQRLRQATHRMRLDERDLTEVVELLREIEPVYAKEEKLSALERVQIRIRLSRFGIGSSQGKAEDAPTDLKGKLQSRKNGVDQELMRPL